VPVGTADSYCHQRGHALVIPATGVLSNDSDADGNALTACWSLVPPTAR
jgi:hypothetical protein